MHMSFNEHSLLAFPHIILLQFAFFCATSPAHDVVAEHKAVLRGRYDEARALGTQVTAAKQRIAELKSAMEQRRLAHTMAALMRQQQGGSADEEEEREEQRQADAEEGRIKAQIDQVGSKWRVVPVPVLVLVLLGGGWGGTGAIYQYAIAASSTIGCRLVS